MKTINQLGEGHFGCVYRRYHAFQGTHVAIKRTRPTALDLRAGPIQSYKDLLEKCQEVRTLVRLKHSLANDAPVTRGNDPSDDQQQKFPIMQLYEFFWNGKDLHLVLELMYVNFREWILQQVSFSEEQAKEAAKSILTGLKILNDHNIVHRDIKEDNIMFRLQNDLRTLTICDFGFAQDLSLSSKEKSSSFSNTTTGLCGSLGYLAPEIYMGVPYGTSVDLFSFGVLLFRILSAEKPWPEVPREATESATIHLQYIVDDGHPQWQTVSKHGKALVRRLLQYSKDRITAVDALGHQWFGERSMSILQTNPSTAYFPGARARKTSQAIIEDVSM